MLRHWHTEGKNVLLLLVLGALFIGEARAAWWTKLLDTAGDTSRAMATKSVSAVEKLQGIIRSRPPGTRPVHALRTSDGKVLSVDANGKEVLIATAGVGGAWALTTDGAALIRVIDLIVPEEELVYLNDLLKRVADTVVDRPIHLVRNDGTFGRVLVEQMNGQRMLMAEKYPGVFLEVAAQHADELAWVLEQPIHAGKLRVVSLFHESDAEVLRRIDDALGEIHQPRGHVSPEAVAKAVRAQKQKTVFVVGHVEGNRFVVRDAAGNIQGEIPIAHLEAAAREADASIFMLGCSAGVCSRSSGYIDAVNAIHVANGLKEAIRKRTFGEALSALSTDSGRIYIRPTIIDPIRSAMVVDQKADAISKRSFQAIRLSTVARGRSHELAERIIPMIPTWIQFPYLAGLFFLVFSLRPILRDWASFRMPAPRFGHRPMVSVLVKGIRAVGFILMMPFATIVYHALTIAPWALWFLASTMFSGVAGFIASFISAGFGWRLWELHREALANEPWTRRFWIIPLCSTIVTLTSSYCLHLFPWFYIYSPDFNYDEADQSLRIAYWSVSALVAIALSFALLAFLRKWRWNPNDLLDWIIAAPIVLIEIAARRLIERTRALSG